MKRALRSTQADAPAAPPEARLAVVPALSLDDDQRPSREDMTYAGTISNRSIAPRPRFLTGRKKPSRR